MLLVGAGSHAARLLSLFDLRRDLHAVCAPEIPIWLNSPSLGDVPLNHYRTESEAEGPGVFLMGMGGVRPEQLQRRLALARWFQAKGWHPFDLAHPKSFVASETILRPGAHIMNGAQISAHCLIGEHVLINAGSIIEHHSVIGAGSHIAPGAVILGNVVIGECCMIGANATVIEGTKVPDGTMVKANTVWKVASK